MKALAQKFNEPNLDGIIFEKIGGRNETPNVRAILNNKQIQISIGCGSVYEVEYDENQQPWSGAEICTVSELMQNTEFAQFNKCLNCGGDGFIEVGPTCSKPASMCCGGCYKKIECECEYEYEIEY